jgi:hypothetical protein
MPLVKAAKPFIFKTQLSLVEATGLKARDLGELVRHLRDIPEASVYYHTHHFLQQHQYMTPEPPNDFAYWVTQVLQEEVIGEKLAAIDTVRFTSLASLRDVILRTLERHLEVRPALRIAPDGEEFHFMKCTLFNLPTSYIAHDLKGFLECLKKVSIGSLYNHVFEGRLRPPLGTNDFSNWLSESLDEKKLAAQIDKLDPYTQTMEGLRNKIVSLIEHRLEESARAEA